MQTHIKMAICGPAKLSPKERDLKHIHLLTLAVVLKAIYRIYLVSKFILAMAIIYNRSRSEALWLLESASQSEKRAFLHGQTTVAAVRMGKGFTLDCLFLKLLFNEKKVHDNVKVACKRVAGKLVRQLYFDDALAVFWWCGIGDAAR
jgi:hypothetical protein